MKRILLSVFAGLTALSMLAGCGQQSSPNSQPQSQSQASSVFSSSESSSTTAPESSAPAESTPTTEPESAVPTEGSKTLVVYFSMPETTDPNNMTQDEDRSTVVIDGEVLGNTQYMAQVIQETTGGDLFRIEPVTPYPTDHDTLVDQAAQEQAENARPAIAGQVEKLESYDVVFLGYPNWWGDMPMILYTFLEQYDLSSKTIVPFNTHGGSGFSGTIGTIRELEPDAQVLDGLSISRNSIQDAREEIVSWVNGLDLEQ